MDNNPPDEKFDRKERPNKPMYYNMQWLAIEAIARVFQFSFSKYGNTNTWKYPRKDGADPIEIYSDAMWRHWIAHRNGEITDAESGLPHLYHFGWCALTIIELWIMQGRNKEKK